MTDSKWSIFFLGVFLGAFFAVTVKTLMGA